MDRKRRKNPSTWRESNPQPQEFYSADMCSTAVLQPLMVFIVTMIDKLATELTRLDVQEVLGEVSQLGPDQGHVGLQIGDDRVHRVPDLNLRLDGEDRVGEAGQARPHGENVRLHVLHV